LTTLRIKEPPVQTRRTSAPARRLVGESVPRVEDRRILTGAGRYIDDIVRPGMLYAGFLRSPLAHARIASIDVEEARAEPGVVAVFTAADFAPGTTPMQAGDGPSFGPLADGRALHVGDPVAIVVASSRYAAEDGRDRIALDLDPLPVVASTTAALAPDAAPIFEELESNVVSTGSWEYGDTEAAFARATVVVSRTFHQQRQSNAPIEPRGLIADFDPGTGELTVWASNQRPHGMRLEVAKALGLAAHRVRVIVPDVGGGFGQKIVTTREDVAVCIASRLVGKPVKWIEDRVESLTAAGQAREESLELRLAATADGKLVGLDAKLILDQGAYPAVPIPSSLYGDVVRILLPGPYRIEGFRFEQTMVATNKPSYVPYRGPWAIEAWARETLIDLVAAELGLDLFEVRRRNLVRPDEQPCRMVTGPTLLGVTALGTLERAAQLIDLESFRADQRAAKAEGRLLGLGIATFIEAAPGPTDYYEAAGMPTLPEPARVRLEPDGTLTVFSGQAPNGQGHATTLAQVAADELGVPLASVRVVHGDTDSAPFQPMGTGGSRAATRANGAVMLAARAVRSRALAVAAGLLNLSAEELELSGGFVSVRGTPGTRLTLADVADAAAFDSEALAPGGIEEQAHVTEPLGGWSQATHCCFVEIDAATGLAQIPRYLVVEDCGAMVNPAIVDGQLRGGIAQGIGSVLLEHSAYDDEGQPRAATLMDYLLPTVSDLPAVEIEHLHSPPVDEIDFRGVGEGGAIGSPAALANALADATGIATTVRPMTPSRILEALGTIEPEPPQP
jgi:aerobic carbon-monoxide dehydrogenase large subunit